jgi:hypothetical protein
MVEDDQWPPASWYLYSSPPPVPLSDGIGHSSCQHRTTEPEAVSVATLRATEIVPIENTRGITVVGFILKPGSTELLSKVVVVSDCRVSEYIFGHLDFGLVWLPFSCLALFGCHSVRRCFANNWLNFGQTGVTSALFMQGRDRERYKYQCLRSANSTHPISTTDTRECDRQCVCCTKALVASKRQAMINQGKSSNSNSCNWWSSRRTLAKLCHCHCDGILFLHACWLLVVGCWLLVVVEHLLSDTMLLIRCEMCSSMPLPTMRSSDPDNNRLYHHTMIQQLVHVLITLARQMGRQWIQMQPP